MASVLRGSDNWDSADSVSGIVRAWANWESRLSFTVRDSYGISSITDNGAGDYTLNFSTAFANNDYAVSTGVKYSNRTTWVGDYQAMQVNTLTTTTCKLLYYTGTDHDMLTAMVVGRL
jgi:hypothetical protein